MNAQQMIITLFAILGILSAVIAFIKTPKSERYRLQPPKQTGVEYAPEYTTQEKIQILIKNLAWVIPAALAFKFWFLPWLKQYTSRAHCVQYGHFSGLDLLIFGLFVGLPLMMSLLIFLTIGKRCLKIIKIGQDPLPGEKTFKPTPYLYGTKAKLKAYGGLALVFLSFCLCVQGCFWAQSFSNSLPKDGRIKHCQSTPAINTQ